MFTVKNENVLPEILFAAHKFYEEVTNLFASVTSEHIADKTAAYLSNGFLFAKAGLGDLCVGIKALGDKLGVLGGNSFVMLKENSDALVSATGNFFNSINAENFYDQAKDYLSLLANALKEVSNATTHLYGDAKCRLGDQFANMESAMVSFFRMAKVKIVAALTDLQIATAYALQYFAIPNNLTDTNLVNQDGTLNKQSAGALVLTLVPDFDDAKNLALKMFN